MSARVTVELGDRSYPILIEDGLLADPAPEAAFAAEAALPWIKRVFHLYTGPDNLTRIEELKVKDLGKDWDGVYRATSK